MSVNTGSFNYIQIARQAMETHPKSSQNKNTDPCRIEGDSSFVAALRKLNQLMALLGSAFGVLGALLLAMPALPAWGFGAFLVSNVAWLLSSYRQRQWPFHCQQWVFLCCSLIGLWNWWLAPLLGESP